MSSNALKLPDTSSLEAKRQFEKFRCWEAWANELRAIDTLFVEQNVDGCTDSLTIFQLLTEVPQIGYRIVTEPVYSHSSFDRRSSFLGGHPWTSASYPWPPGASPIAQLNLPSIQHLTSLELEPVLLQIWGYESPIAVVRSIPLKDVEIETPSEAHEAGSGPLGFHGGDDHLFAMKFTNFVEPRIVFPRYFPEEAVLCLDGLKPKAKARVQHILAQLQDDIARSTGCPLQLFGLSFGRQRSPDEHYALGDGLLMNLDDRGADDDPGVNLFTELQEISLFARQVAGKNEYSAFLDGN